MSSPVRPRVGFVVQRCGLEVNGGAEFLCRTVAEHLSRYWDVEVITTCALDYMTWRNQYPPGVSDEGGVRFRRFPVSEPRNVAAFNLFSESIQARLGGLTREQEETWMRAQGPWSPELLDYLSEQGGRYEAFVFFTYLYATTYFGLPRVADRAFLVPTAHDEWPIRMGIWKAFFGLPRAFIFNTEEERAFMARQFPALRLEGRVVGVAVDPPAATDPEGFRRRYGIEGPFALYVGRLDPSKGINDLVAGFRTYRAVAGEKGASLVLLGRSNMNVPPADGIIETGFVDDQTKWDALAACTLLVMPSPFESLSIALLEAWAMGKPVLVNSRSQPLVGQCRRAQGGIWYEGSQEFAFMMHQLLDDPSLRQSLGEQGRAFVRRFYSWARVERDYLELTQMPAGPSSQLLGR